MIVGAVDRTAVRLARAAVLWLLLASAPAFALFWDKDLGLPAPAPVVDEFGLLDSRASTELSGLLRTVKERSGVEISVFIAKDLRGKPIEDFSIATAEKWQLGKKKEDKALILLVAPKEHKMRIEVGYGLEGQLTDAFSRRVLEDVLRPFFRQGRYAEGIIASIYAIQEKVPLGLDDKAKPAIDSDRPGEIGGPRGFSLFGALIVFFLLISFLRFLGFLPPSRGRYYGGGWGGGGWGGGGGRGGSSWGGGGGGFGGGGASSDW